MTLTDDFQLLNHVATLNLQENPTRTFTVVSEGGRLDAALLENTFCFGEKVAHPGRGRG